MVLDDSMIFMNDRPERRLDLQKYKNSEGQSVCHYRCTKLFDFDSPFSSYRVGNSVFSKPMSSVTVFVLPGLIFKIEQSDSWSLMGLLGPA